MILMIDNYDSFTYNLYHYFLILGQDTMVKSRNEISIKEIEKLTGKTGDLTIAKI